MKDELDLGFSSNHGNIKIVLDAKAQQFLAAECVKQTGSKDISHWLGKKKMSVVFE